MIVDSSAILSIVFREEGAAQVVEKISRASGVGVGAPTLVEASLVIRSRLELDPLPVLDRFVRDFDVTVVGFSTAHWREASDAFGRYGKGRHPAALNFGDCMCYAIAKLAGQPLLYVGEDFSQTDVEIA